MTEGLGKLVRDIIIAIGVFVPLINYIHHLLQSYAGSVNVFYLPHSEQLTLLALTLVPLIVLRLVYPPNCRIQSSSRHRPTE
jgi:hypothetical protein